MKKLTLHLFTALVIILFSCNENKTTVTPSEEIPQESNLIKAKKISLRIYTTVEIADEGKITKDQLDMAMLPYQDTLRQLFPMLTAEEQQDLNAYRAKLLSDMADRKVARDK